MELPANTTGVPMIYMTNDKQYAAGFPAELLALSVP